MRRERRDRQLDVLAERVRALDATFCCGGSIPEPAPVVLRFADGKRIAVPDGRRSLRNDVGKRLMKRCAPAPFGVGAETRHDLRVRDGGQLRAEGGAFVVEGLDLAASGIVEAVRRELCPDDAAPPEAELYALNVYGPRGHFVGHKDTPRDPDCFGTLVVCLPVPFSGGELILRHETTRVFEWELTDYFGLRKNAEPLQWAAFYGDVDHEVTRVTGGHRVTLTWLLRRAEGGAGLRRAPAATERELELALLECLGDERFMPAGGTLGVPCVHLYGATPGFARPAPALGPATVARLKGRDRLCALAAMSAGLSACYRPYLFETGATESWRLTRAPSEAEARIFKRRQLGWTELSERMPLEEASSTWSRDDGVTWIVEPPWSFERDGVEAATQPLGHLEYSATDYFGNEGCDSTFYVSAAILLSVPPASSRRKPTSSAARPQRSTRRTRAARGARR